jgi:hypothetical protein
MKRDGTLEEASGSGRLGERMSEGLAQARGAVRSKASELVGEAADMTRERVGEATQGARMTVRQLVEERPVHLFLGAAALGFLLGRFG